MRNGSYVRSHTYKASLPMTIGMERAGTIAQLDAGLLGIKVGEKVSYCLSRGSYAEFAVVPCWKLVPAPSDFDLRIATALMLQGSTAHYLSRSAFPLQPGNWCLVHAGTGGVGQLIIQLAKRAGAAVTTTVGSEEKAELARRRGADHAVLYRTVDFAEEVKRLTDGKGVDVVYDSVGKDTLMRSLRCLRRRGLCVGFGASSGQPEPVALLDLAEAGSVFLTRPHLADYMATADEIRERAAEFVHSPACRPARRGHRYGISPCRSCHCACRHRSSCDAWQAAPESCVRRY
jgi:NADPH:quinone reductase